MTTDEIRLKLLGIVVPLVALPIKYVGAKETQKEEERFVNEVNNLVNLIHEKCLSA